MTGKSSPSKRKYTKKSDYWSQDGKSSQTPINNQSNTNNSVEINKATNTDQRTSRLRLSELGSTALATVQWFVDWCKPIELRFPQSLRTYTKMVQDEDVSTALDANYLFVEKAFDEWTISFNKENPKSEEAAKFVDWCFKNMERQTLRQAVRDALTYKQFGFSILEKVYMAVTEGEHVGKYKIKRLGHRPQQTLDQSEPFVYEEGGRDITYARQNTGYFMNSPTVMHMNMPDRSIIQIPRNKFMLFGYNATDSNPLGVSPLESIYTAWREKLLIQEYEVTGVSKDLGGTPVMYIPKDILNKAAEDPASPEAKSVELLSRNLSNLHAGQQNMMILPSDIQEGVGSSVPEYSIKFLGIDGQGKQFDTSKLIDQRKKVIYDRFGAGFLIMGNNATGSYSLSDNKQTLHAHFIERDVELISEVINNDLIPQLLALNGIYLSDEDMPVFVQGDIGDPDIEANSKMIQRVVSVGALPLTPEVLNEILAKCNFKYRVADRVITSDSDFADFSEKYLPPKTSKAGEGMSKGSGNGTSDSAAGTDNSSLNMDNAS